MTNGTAYKIKKMYFMMTTVSVTKTWLAKYSKIFT